MVIKSPKYVVEPLSESTMEWFVEVASVNMLIFELDRPGLVNVPHLYELARKVDAAFISKIDGEPVGAIAGFIVPNLFNPEYQTLSEVMWYVLPEYRQSRAGLLLLKKFIEHGETVANDTTFSLLPSSDVNFESLERKGLKLEEFAFRKENKWPLLHQQS